jgi:hypothetical protein
MFRVAVREPEAEGLKMTDTLHMALGASAAPQVVAVLEKSAAFVPVIVKGVGAKVTVELPEFVSEIMTGDELWPTIVEGKD